MAAAQSASRKSAKSADIHVAALRRVCSTQGLNTRAACTSQRLIGTKRREHLVAEIRRCAIALVTAKIVGRDHPSCRATLTSNFFRMPCAADLPWRACALARSQIARRVRLIQQFVDAEVALQLEMSPVVKRIAQRVREPSRPRPRNFSYGSRVAGAKTFRDAVGAHGPPLVVIAFQPDLEEVVEAAVVRDVVRRKMAVIVENRLVLGESVIEVAGGASAEQKIFVDEGARGLRLCGRH